MECGVNLLANEQRVVFLGAIVGLVFGIIFTVILLITPLEMWATFIIQIDLIPLPALPVFIVVAIVFMAAGIGCTIGYLYMRRQ